MAKPRPQPKPDTTPTKDEQCHDCRYAWPNMQGITGQGFCFMFLARNDDCGRRLKVTLPVTPDRQNLPGPYK